MLLKRTFFLLLAIVVLSVPAAVNADTLTFQAPATAPNAGSGGPNQFDLDHHSAYTWRIDNVNLTGQTITGATLTFTNIRNWDSNPNMLFIHLLDSARSAGVASPAHCLAVTLLWLQALETHCSLREASALHRPPLFTTSRPNNCKF
jgi:hypothetical protein